MESPETVVKVAQRILDAMREPIELPSESLQSGVSIGIAIGDTRHRTTDEALRDADTALYRAKSNGRNRCPIEPIDWRMYRLAMEHGKALVRHGGYITINVSPRHFQSGDLDQRLMQVVRDAGFDPTKLHIEVTEGTLLGDADAA